MKGYMGTYGTLYGRLQDGNGNRCWDFSKTLNNESHSNFLTSLASSRRNDDVENIKNYEGKWFFVRRFAIDNVLMM